MFLSCFNKHCKLYLPVVCSYFIRNFFTDVWYSTDSLSKSRSSLCNPWRSTFERCINSFGHVMSISQKVVKMAKTLHSLCRQQARCCALFMNLSPSRTSSYTFTCGTIRDPRDTSNMKSLIGLLTSSSSSAKFNMPAHFISNHPAT